MTAISDPVVIGHRLFDTPVGRCAIAWSALGVLSVQLPEASDDRTRARLLRGLRVEPQAGEAAPPPSIARAIGQIVALLEGERTDLRDILLDWRRTPAFHRRVYEQARCIDPGSTLTYGELARLLDEPGAARAVGQALGSNPFVIVVPCHRVLAAQGRSGGFSAPGGIRTKERLLSIEQAFSRAPKAGDSFPLF